MISKVIRRVSKLLHRGSNRLPFSEAKQQHIVQEVLGEFINYSKTKDLAFMADEEFSEICAKIFSLQHTINLKENYSGIVKKIESMDLRSKSLSVLGPILQILPILTQTEAVSIETNSTLTERVEKCINEHQKGIENESEKLEFSNLLSFLAYSSGLMNMTLSNKVCSLLFEQIEELLEKNLEGKKIKELSTYLWIVNRSKLPSNNEKEMFSKFVHSVLNYIKNYKIENKTKTNEIGILVLIYKGLKSINFKLYKCPSPVSQLEEIIIENLLELEEKEIFHLATASKSLGSKDPEKISKIIYTMLMDSVSENGNSGIDSSTLLNLIGRICENNQVKLSSKNEEKMMKFIGKNLDKGELIRKLVHKEYFNRKQLQVLSEMVLQLSYEEQYSYHHSQIYLYQMLLHQIYTPEMYESFVSSIKTNKNEILFNEKFMITAVIVNQLLSRYSNQNYGHHENKEQELKMIPKLEELFHFFSETVKEFTHQVLWLSPFIMWKSSIIHEFDRIYHNKLYKTAIQEVLEGNKLKLSLFELAVFHSDSESLQKLIEQDRVPMFYFKILLAKISNNPLSFSGHYDTINSAILSIVRKGTFLKEFYLYLCNWKVHFILNENEIKGFLLLATSSLNGFKFNIIDFITYFLDSPSKLIRGSHEYVVFLQNACENILQKKQIFSQWLLNELAKINGLTYNYAKLTLEKKQIENSSFNQSNLKLYCEFLVKGENRAHRNENIVKNCEIKGNNLFIFSRFAHVTQKLSEEEFQFLLETVEMAKFHEIEESLINLTLNKNNERSLILCEKLLEKFNALLSNYRVFLPHVLRNLFKNPKNYEVMHSLENKHHKNSEILLRIGSKTNELLLKTSKIILSQNTKDKEIQRISFELYVILLQECVFRQNDCCFDICQCILEKFDNNNILNYEKVYSIVEEMLVCEPEKFLDFVSKRNHRNVINAVTLHFDFIDIRDEKIMNIVEKIMNSSIKNKPMINSGIYEFMAYQNEKVKELRDRFEIVNKNNQNNWLRQYFVDFLAMKNVHFEELRVHGYRIIKVGEKYFLFLNKNHIPKAVKKVKEFLLFLLYRLNIPENDPSKMVPIFIGKEYNKRVLSYSLMSEIEELNSKKEEFYEFVCKPLTKEGNKESKNKRKSEIL